jgi:hypothetical protein
VFLRLLKIIAIQMKQIVVLLIAVLSVSCAKKPTEIYKLKNTGYSKYFEEYAGWKTEP